MRKRFILCPDACSCYKNQEIEINAPSADGKEIWINLRRGQDRIGLCLIPEEMIEFAKTLYKAAYAAGYKPEHDPGGHDDGPA